jgi:hypothetical protein
LRRRLADLRAASSVNDLVAGTPQLSRDASGAMQLNIGEGFVIRFVPNHPKQSKVGDRDLDWKGVTRVKVVGIAKDAIAK